MPCLALSPHALQVSADVMQLTSRLAALVAGEASARSTVLAQVQVRHRAEVANVAQAGPAIN